MPQMYCPQCGRELDLDSGDIRFCRYCGFALLDTKESLQGFSQQKRTGFSIVTWSYALLLIVTLLLHGKYVSLDTTWIYWLLTALIVVSVSFFCSAAVSALKPAMFSKGKGRDKTAIGPQANTTAALADPGDQATNLLRSSGEAAKTLTRERVKEPRSVVEGTTKRLSDESHLK